jgi:hypothetical protein
VFSVLSITGLTSPGWTIGKFQMVRGVSCQCINRTKNIQPCESSVRHDAFTEYGCGFVPRH